MLKIKQDGNITEIKLDNVEKLDLWISESLRAPLHELFEKPNAKVLLDLSGVMFIDSSGFALLLSIAKSAGKNNGRFVIYNIGESAMNYFKILQLDKFFKIAPDKEAAMLLTD